MKILFIGDPHLKISRFELSKDFLSWVNKTVAEIKPDLVVNLGDTFDTHSIVRAEIASVFHKHVLEVSSITPYYYVLGNHDMFRPNDNTYHALQPFMHIENFTVIDKIVNLNGITWVPYQADHTNFPSKTLSLCVAHQTFVGANFGNGYRPEDGVDSDAISADLIISGHIHTRQQFGKVIYPGSPFSQGIDDAGQDKGLMLFDTDTFEYTFIQSPFPRWHVLKCEINGDFNISKLHDFLNNEPIKTDNWVIDIVGPKSEIAAYLGSEDFLNLKKDRLIKIKPTYTDLIKSDRIQIKAVSIYDILSEYIEKVYDGSLDKDLLKKESLKIINNTNSI